MADSLPHPKSYYFASANHQTDYPVLQGEEKCDVCVIGGGVTGISTALHLTERGYHVILLEENRIGWGASGRNGGQSIFGYSCEMSKIRSLVGNDDAKKLWDLSLEALQLTKTLIRENDIQCDWADGQMHAAIKPRQHRELELWRAELSADYQYENLEIWTGSKLKSKIDTERYLAGLFDPNSGHLHPLNYTLGLADAAIKRGVRIFEKSAVLEVNEGKIIKAITSSGEVSCRYLVLAGNAYLSGFAGRISNKLMPVGTYIGASEPLGEERARSLIQNNMAVADINFVLDYYRLSADHRMLFGGRVSYSTVPPLHLAKSMKARMLKVFPQLSDVSIEYAWGGFVGITMNRAPHFGRIGKNLFFAHGFSGHGVALTGLAGKLMADAISGTAEQFDVFSRIPHHSFPGGAFLRMPALVLAMAYYRLRDLLP
jgi:gamma-glutamylputrescine oxidase